MRLRIGIAVVMAAFLTPGCGSDHVVGPGSPPVSKYPKLINPYSVLDALQIAYQDKDTTEIKALKIWKRLRGLDFLSFYVELFAIRAINSNCSGSVATNVWTALQAILRLYNFNRSFESGGQIKGIVTLRSRRSSARSFPRNAPRLG